MSQVEADLSHPHTECATAVAAGDRLASHQMLCDGSGFVPVTHEQAEPHDRDVIVGFGPGRRPSRQSIPPGRLGSIHSSSSRWALLPPKPKLLIAARRGPSHVPGFGLGEQTERRIGDEGQRIVDVQRRGTYARAHRREHLDGSRGTGGCDGVSQIGFQ